MMFDVETPYVLIIQYDGYIIDPSKWSDEFLKYDYIGAKWPWYYDGHNVGNSGFCLRSRNLLEHLKKVDCSEEPIADDHFICRVARPLLEQYGVKFAPDYLADKFSYERQFVSQTFGFHGLFNIWRHVSDENMAAMIPLMPEYVVRKAEYDELIKIYVGLDKPNIYEAMVARRQELIGEF